MKKNMDRRCCVDPVFFVSINTLDHCLFMIHYDYDYDDDNSVARCRHKSLRWLIMGQEWAAFFFDNSLLVVSAFSITFICQLRVFIIILS